MSCVSHIDGVKSLCRNSKRTSFQEAKKTVYIEKKRRNEYLVNFYRYQLNKM